MWDLPPSSEVMEQMTQDPAEYAVVDYPMGYTNSKLWLYYQTLHGKPIVDGHLSRYRPEQYEFIVEEVTDTGITGPNIGVDFERMASLKVWKVDVDESIEKGVMGTFYTTQIILGVGVLIALIVL